MILKFQAVPEKKKNSS